MLFDLYLERFTKNIHIYEESLFTGPSVRSEVICVPSFIYSLHVDKT